MSSAEVEPGLEREIGPGRRGLRSAVDALRYRNYALFWTGALVSNTGTWVQNVTVPFVVYQLTGSAVWVGFAGFAQMIPAAVLGPVGGTLADRFHRRSVLLVMQSLQALVALALWWVWSAGVRSPGVIVALTAVSGLCAGLYIGSWQAFVSELVPREALLNAVTLNSVQFSAARAFGPAIGGIVLAWLGPSSAFLLNAVSFGAVIVALLAIRVPRLKEKVTGRTRVIHELAETVRYVRGSPGIVACLTVVIALGFLGSPVFQLVVVFAEEVFHVGEGAFGLLGAALGIGAILGTPLIAGPGADLPRRRLVTVAMVGYGTSLVVFALAPTFAVGFVGLLGAGAGYLAIAASLNTTIQMQVDERMRGKVLSLYVMGITVTIPLGSLVQGWSAEVLGPRATVALAGGAFLLVAVVLKARGRLVHLDDEHAVLDWPEAPS
jgi:MFS family permease